jgi:predicted esterase
VIGLACLGLTLASTSAWAQWPRYELGRRVREFERAWSEVRDEQAKVKAAEALSQAVRSFFGLAFGEAGRGIAHARLTLLGQGPPTPDRLWVESVAVLPESRFLDTTARTLKLTLEPFFPVGDAIPPQATLTIEIVSATSPDGVGEPLGSVEVAIDQLPKEVVLHLRPMPDGDHRLRATVKVGERHSTVIEERLSAVNRRDERLEALRQTLARWPDQPRTTERESARFLLDQLARLAEGGTLELDVPAAARLVELEGIVESVRSGQAYFTAARWGNFWLALATPDGSRSVPARLLVPDASPQERPLVIALHGAGGSENLFFESYGHGAIVELCRDRGWFLVAPRSALGLAPLEALIEELDRLYPIDRSRVVLVGHSMGAAQAVGAVVKSPDRFAALAALGGGGLVPHRDGLERLPAFVGVGDRDFALKGARSLAEALRAAGLGDVTYREYPGIEHLAIVQVALPDVFAFFDTRLARGPR